VKGNENGKEKKSKEGKLDYERNEPAGATISEDADLQNSQEAETFDRHGEEKSIENGPLQGKELSEINRQGVGLRGYLRNTLAAYKDDVVFHGGWARRLRHKRILFLQSVRVRLVCGGKTPLENFDF
jgi:hypothetical protein